MSTLYNGFQFVSIGDAPAASRHKSGSRGRFLASPDAASNVGRPCRGPPAASTKGEGHAGDEASERGHHSKHLESVHQFADQRCRKLRQQSARIRRYASEIYSEMCFCWCRRPFEKKQTIISHILYNTPKIINIITSKIYFFVNFQFNTLFLITLVQARSQPEKSQGAPVRSKGAPKPGIRGGGSRRSFRNSRGGGSRRSFRNWRGVVGEVFLEFQRRGTQRGAFSGGALHRGHSAGGTQRGHSSGVIERGALNDGHSAGDIQRGALHFSGGARPQNAPPWLRACSGPCRGSLGTYGLIQKLS